MDGLSEMDNNVSSSFAKLGIFPQIILVSDHLVIASDHRASTCSPLFFYRHLSGRDKVRIDDGSLFIISDKEDISFNKYVPCPLPLMFRIYQQSLSC